MPERADHAGDRGADAIGAIKGADAARLARLDGYAREWADAISEAPRGSRE